MINNTSADNNNPNASLAQSSTSASNLSSPIMTPGILATFLLLSGPLGYASGTYTTLDYIGRLYVDPYGEQFRLRCVSSMPLRAWLVDGRTLYRYIIPNCL